MLTIEAFLLACLPDDACCPLAPIVMFAAISIGASPSNLEAKGPAAGLNALICVGACEHITRKG